LFAPPSYGELDKLNNCTINGVKPNNENIGSKDTGRLVLDWFYVSMALGFVVGFWGDRGMGEV
jgi:hypothetical protein